MGHVEQNSKLSVPSISIKLWSIVVDGTVQATNVEHGDETVVGKHETCGRDSVQASSKDDSASSVGCQHEENTNGPDVDNDQCWVDAVLAFAFILGPQPPPRCFVFNLLIVLGLVSLVTTPLPPVTSVSVLILSVGLVRLIVLVVLLVIGCLLILLILGLVIVVRTAVRHASKHEHSKWDTSGQNGREGPYQKEFSVVVSAHGVDDFFSCTKEKKISRVECPLDPLGAPNKILRCR